VITVGQLSDVDSAEFWLRNPRSNATTKNIINPRLFREERRFGLSGAPSIKETAAQDHPGEAIAALGKLLTPENDENGAKTRRLPMV
jgi:hypothetical protein